MARDRILVCLGHPMGRQSFCGGLAQAYVEGAHSAGAEVKELVLSELEFDPIRRGGYGVEQPLEPDLVRAQEEILWAQHLVFVHPIWWGTYPGLLKGFIDRVLLPGYAFQPHDNDPFWDKLLTGRSARLIVTMSAPVPWYRMMYRSCGTHALRNATLKFCGIQPVRETALGRVSSASESKRQAWLARARRLGAARI